MRARRLLTLPQRAQVRGKGSCEELSVVGMGKALCCGVRASHDKSSQPGRVSKLRLKKNLQIHRPQPILPRPQYPPAVPRQFRSQQASKVSILQPYENAVFPAESDKQATGIVESMMERWKAMPEHHRLVVASSVAFVICNMDKVNMSVAIIPMAQEFGWKASMAGLVQSSFFWGYLLCQLPGGYICSKLGGRMVMPGGVGLWSLATTSLPLLAGSLPGLVMSRVFVGAGEAVAPSSATDMVARTVPEHERSRAMSCIFGGLHVGSVLGLLLAPIIIERFGWCSVFIAFGSAGLVWVAWFELVINDFNETNPSFSQKLRPGQGIWNKVGDDKEEDVPWRAIIRSRPVQALGFAHFCNNWFSYSMLAWLPSYFTDTLNLDLSHAAQVSLLPPVAGIIVSSIVGQAADHLVSNGWKTALVRKLFQCLAFMGPFCALAGATQNQDNAAANIGLVTLALGLSSFSLGGLYCNHQDLSPKYSSLLLGLTNTWATIPGIVGVLLTGFLLDQTGDWPTALFFPSMILYVAGSVVYTIHGRSDALVFNDDDDKPFEIETKLASMLGSWWPFSQGSSGLK